MLENINIPIKQIRDFCQRWKIVELALFSSVLRDDFHSESDIDVLVSFSDEDSGGILNTSIP